MTGAIIGASVIGAGASMAAAGSASDSASAATAASSQASAASLAFSKEQYEDWKATFGDVQDNLSAYYKNLTPAAIEASGIQNINSSYAQASKQVTQSLAQRGISSSGLEGQAIVDLATKQAHDTANLRVQAPIMAAQEKMKFLALGLNQGSAAVAGVGNAYSNQASLAAQQAGMYNTQASQAGSSLAGSLSGGINSYMNYTAMQNQNALLQNALGAGSGGTSSVYSGSLTDAYFG